jgi:hypothetical protein
VPSSLEITNDANVITIIRGSKPLSASIEVCHDFRVLGECPQPTDGKANITSLYTGKFGAPAAGTKLFIQANQMIDGYEDIPHQWHGVVPAST